MTCNRLSADEFQPLFVKLNHEERMHLLERLEGAISGPQAVVATQPPSSSQRYRPNFR
jgi:hypothetical protein